LKDLPVVLLHDNISEENAMGYSVASYIWPRLDALAELVHLLVAMRGCRNLSVAMVDPKNHAIRSEKLSIIKSALDEHGLSLKTDRQLFYVREYSYAQGVDVVGRILEENPSTDGIICLADVTAIGILDRLDKLGLRGQIKVTGFDNVEVAAQNDLTTIDQQLHLTGERALLDLHTAIDNVPFKEFRAGSYIPTILVQRGSA
jgi:DNA-binding LacI/PurR family transcriptional regulator